MAYSTGGSTGEPTRFPEGKQDLPHFYANSYVGRSWWGIEPFDSNVHLWGHAHLFGSGWRGQVQQLKRAAKDRAVNRVRLSGYDQSEAGLRRHYEALVKARPAYLSGNTSTVFKLARHIETHQLSVRDLAMRGVMVTTETVSDADIELIEHVFGVPVMIEYGAAETGVVAFSAGPGARPLRVLWDSFVALVDEAGELRLTTLDPRLFPLVNYPIGDQVEAAPGNALTFQAVLGRTQDFVRVPTVDGGGLDLLAILPIHILKTYPGVLAVQFEQQEGHLRIFVQSADPDANVEHLHRFFVRELVREHPDADPRGVSVTRMDEPQRTIAGKHTLFRV
jgi:phenylacetate-coenzyme A ligase PaaK-like adenylate-forming protein